MYPPELSRRRWIEQRWRAAAIRHGFDEIDGPTFEHTELYTLKSGDGIVSEIFGVFSGKDEAAVKELGQRLASGENAPAPFALRPEFTPTLARMYAARAGQLPKPTRWFWQQTCFRAERPQRGRLREFMQWNCDIIGTPAEPADAAAYAESLATQDVDAIAACVGLMEDVGLTPEMVKVRLSSRAVLGSIIRALGVSPENESSAFVLLDRRDRLDDADLEAMAFEFGIHEAGFLAFLKRPRGKRGMEEALSFLEPAAAEGVVAPLRRLLTLLEPAGLSAWCEVDLNIARGLAYYTGMVFEVHETSGAMRAIAGGGRYDNLIETFGGPPTPAVGFGMGDVVLSLVLSDRGLMPDDRAIAGELGLRPDAFVISNGTPESDSALTGLVTRLRAARLHARRSSKATKNIGKLLKDASDCGARFAVIIESASEATLKNLDANTQERVGLADVPAKIAGAR